MKSIIANTLAFQADHSVVSTFLHDMRNFRKIMPEQIEDWSADELSCSFFIKNLGKLGMKKGNFDIGDQFDFPSNENSKVKFILIFHYLPEVSGGSKGHFELKADMNPMIEMMARRPLTNFVNILSENLNKLLKQ